MKFGIFYEHQLPRPWTEGAEQKLFNDALEQVEVADRLGIDYAWEVEHHFLEEYSHSSAPEVFLAACAARTKNIRLGQGIRQVIPQYNHPARTAEVIATLDLVSNGRVDFGTGESSAVLELGGFGITVEEKRKIYLESTEQICNILAMDPYPGYVGKYFTHAVPQPGAETGAASASAGVGRVFAARNDPHGRASRHRRVDVRVRRSARGAIVGRGVLQHHQERRMRADRPHGQRQHLHGVELLLSPGPRDGDQARAERLRVLRLRARQPLWIRRAQTGAHQSVAGVRKGVRARMRDLPPEFGQALSGGAGGIGTPDDLRTHLRKFETAGVDQVTFIQQAGMNKHEHICEALELFAADVMPEFKARAAERERVKQRELAPYIEAALARKVKMPALRDAEIPVFPALGRRITEEAKEQPSIYEKPAAG